MTYNELTKEQQSAVDAIKKITNENEQSNLISMIKSKKILKNNLFRFYQSGMEYDDTSKSVKKNQINSLTWFNFSK